MNWPFWSLSRPAHSESCESIEPLLSLYVDGMASPEERQRIEAHLPNCKDCREALAWLQATQTALAARPVVTPPVNLQSRIALAIAASSAAPVSLRPARSFTLRPAYAAVVCLTALGLVVSYSMLHAPFETQVRPSVKTVHTASAPVPGVIKTASKSQLPHSLKVRPGRPLVASIPTPSGTFKPHAIKPLPVQREPELVLVPGPQNRVASSVAAHSTPTVHPAPVLVRVPVQRRPEQKLIASRKPAETHQITTPNTTLPKPSDLPLIAKVPAPVPVHIQPPIDIVQPPLQTASETTAQPSKLGDILGSVKTHIGQMHSAAYLVPKQSYRGVANVMHSLDTEHFAYVDGIHSP